MDAPGLSLADAAREFDAPPGYLAAATLGIPPQRAVRALRADLDAWAAGGRDPAGYDGVVARTRASFARLVGVPATRVAIGSQTSALVSVVAAAVPAGAEVLVAEGDFSSVHFPFLARSGVRVRSVPLGALADAVDEGTFLVAFSLVQSATGAVADAAAIREAAARVGALTLCDLTQAAGVLPVAAGEFDATVCHSYKWLCAPRGVAFLTVGERFDALLAPIQAGWYAGDDPWRNVYGPAMSLATDARRFDVSPAWPAWVGAEQSIGLFADLDVADLWAHAAGLGAALCDALGIPEQRQAIVTWPDESGSDLAKLSAAGLKVSGRAGRLRASFHLWNDLADVEAVARGVRAT